MMKMKRTNNNFTSKVFIASHIESVYNDTQPDEHNNNYSEKKYQPTK